MNILAKIVVGAILLADIVFMGCVLKPVSTAKVTKPAVVQVENTVQTPKSEKQLIQNEIIYTSVQIRTSEGSGSGTVIYQDKKIAYILSALHVVENSIRQFAIFQDETHYIYEDIKIVDSCKEFDLVLLSSKPSWLCAAEYIGSARDVEKLDQVWLYGYCGGLENTPILTTGVISQINNTTATNMTRTITSAPIIMGNSGCGMFIKINGHYKLAGVYAQVYRIGMDKAVHIVYHVSMASTPKQTLDFITGTITNNR